MNLLNKMSKKIKNGFTLVELVVVVAIIAILSGVSVAVYSGVTDRAKESKYESLASQGATALRVEYDGELEDNTYFVVTDGGVETYFKYSGGGLDKVDEIPEEDLEYTVKVDSHNSSMVGGVTAYRPAVKPAIDKLNTYLSGDATDHTNLYNAAMGLAKKDFIAIAQTGVDYKFAYSMSENEIYIVDSNDAILYSSSETTTLPSGTEKVVGVALFDEDDLREFSRVSNLHESNCAPSADNIYVKNNPTVICNLYKDITLEQEDNFVPIANWYIYGGGAGQTYYDIRLMMNGNNHTIGTLTYDGFIGGLRPGSIIENLTVDYALGKSTSKPTSLHDTRETLNSHYGSIDCWHTGLFVKYITAVQSKEIIRFKNIDQTGKIYIGGSGDPVQTLGLFIGELNNTACTSTIIEASNINIFNHPDQGDVCSVVRVDGGAAQDGFGAFTGMTCHEGVGTGATKVAFGVTLDNVTHAEITPYGRKSSGSTVEERSANTNPMFGNFEGF